MATNASRIRSRSTAYRGPLLIHAAQRKPSIEDLDAMARRFGVALDGDLSYGAFRIAFQNSFQDL